MKEAINRKSRKLTIPNYSYRLWQKAYNVSEGKNDGALSNISMYFLSLGEIELALEYNQMALNLNGPNQKLIRAIREEIFRITEK
ncbi:hypothetical protein [Leptospira interrogans]|uniref:hypothetical protein n=1 Tax=Leptospira interrogans TaxID=173 RepID=UPI001EEFD226|nr:hypothetical protein [Leptospira interrogans]ULG86610.1 hypothetical protein FH594_21295 [Leptospira interrogans]